MKNSPILITGGAGYIGSHMVRHLYDQNIPCIVLDDLSAGNQDAIPSDIPFYKGDIADTNLVSNIFEQHNFTSVINFAGSIQVNESVIKPELYFLNNTAKTICFLNTLVNLKVKYFIFSSTAAVYGNQDMDQLSEDTPTQPINPYGQSKLFIEQVLADLDRANKIKSICLRYFNAAGAHHSGELAERHDPETHLIPLLIHASLHNTTFKIFGDTYDTPDGSCVRDFIHVEDLASAHLSALKYLYNGGNSTQLNVGTGHGYSVKEVIAKFQQEIDNDVDIQAAEKRAGDPDYLVAATKKITKLLNWQPQHSSIKNILSTTYKSQVKILNNKD